MQWRSSWARRARSGQEVRWEVVDRFWGFVRPERGSEVGRGGHGGQRRHRACSSLVGPGMSGLVAQEGGEHA